MERLVAQCVFSAITMLITPSIESAPRCVIIPLDSAGPYAFNADYIEYYSQLKVYLESHEFADSIQIKPPIGADLSIDIGGIEIHGDSRAWLELQCKRGLSGESGSTVCWRSILNSRPLVLGVRFSSSSQSDFSQSYEKILRYVARDVLCKTQPH